VKWFGRFVRRYPWVVAALVVGAVGLVVNLGPWREIVPWFVGGFAGLVGLLEGVRMVRSLLARRIGLDVLAVTAIFATLAVGEYWASIIIVLMLTGGEALEDAAAHRAKRQLTTLLDNVPTLAHQVTDSGSIVDVAISDVAPGDRLVVRPGEIVPVDSVLNSDAGVFDESSLTGESLPVERGRGETILSGATNGQHAVYVVAVRSAKDSEYQAIVALVEQATSSKAPLVRLADRYAVPFTALAYLIAGVAWWASGDPVRFAEVLVVATPCPLLIAAPVAFMGGMNRAASKGIVIKDAGTLERLSAVTTAAFDKTGTLTLGKPEVVRIHSLYPGLSDDELLRRAASAEQYSTHVLAHTIVDAARRRKLDVLQVEEASEVDTDGVQASIGNQVITVGKARFVSPLGTVDPPVLHPGETAVFVGVNGSYAGYVILKDRVRDDAAHTMARLSKSGITKTFVVSGDNRQTVESVAAAVGIDETFPECLPSDKVDIISRHDAPRVMMVGDGINDAPVLATAGVGVAMGARGSTVASESADVVILEDRLEKVADAVDIGQRTVSIALQSIWLGIIISVALMVVAAWGFLPAIFGALAQEIVDLIAILGALRAVREPRGGHVTQHTRTARSVSSR
jgi:heavy metal translocating P-type ATPase